MTELLICQYCGRKFKRNVWYRKHADNCKQRLRLAPSEKKIQEAITGLHKVLDFVGLKPEIWAEIENGLRLIFL